LQVAKPIISLHEVGSLKIFAVIGDVAGSILGMNLDVPNERETEKEGKKLTMLAKSAPQ